MSNVSIKITAYEYKTFTTFKFYTKLLSDLQKFYSGNKNKGEPPVFSFLEACFIDPSSLPLIISLGNSLKNFHKEPIKLLLNNVPGTSSNSLINFLDKSDFFFLVGNNKNPTFPIGRNIFDFESAMLGWNTSDLQVRNEHKVRGYSKNDIKSFHLGNEPEDLQRDILIEHFSYVVGNEFNDVFEDNEITSESKNDFIDYLSELITNCLIHSDSDCFISLHTNKFRTAISISDTGIGFYESLKKKIPGKIEYQFSELYKSIERIVHIDFSEKSKNHAFSIFEALYFSCLKDRRGLFDLMCSIVVKGHGILRIHNYSVQLVISSKLDSEIRRLAELRERIYRTHIQIKSNTSNTSLLNYQKELADNAKEIFIELFKKIINSYSNDIQFSPIRFFDVEFKGVHIEAEIPRTY